MKATEDLRHEHEIVNLVLDGLVAEIDRMRGTGTLDAEKTGKFLDFFRNFTDRCHHSKEEEILFPLLRGKAPTLVARLEEEHQQGRDLLNSVARELEQVAPATENIAAALAAYAELLRQHIPREDDEFFPLAEQTLSRMEQQKVVEAFDRVESEEMGEGTHERYHHLAHELAGVE